MIMDFQFVRWDEDYSPPTRCALAHEELTYDDYIGHMSGNFGTPVYCNLCRYELHHNECDDQKCDLCHYESALAYQNGSSPDPGSNQEQEHVEDMDTDDEEEEEDGDDDDDGTQAPPDNNDDVENQQGDDDGGNQYDEAIQNSNMEQE